MNDLLRDKALEALEGVVRVADRNTDEFDRARDAIAFVRAAMQSTEAVREEKK